MKLQWLPRFVLDLEECAGYLAEEAGQIQLLRVRHGMMHLPGLFPEDPLRETER